MKNREINIPFVSVVILSFNRRTDLEYTLRKVYEQDYPSYEVIVVDNASNDDSMEMVRKNFPSVRLIPLPENTGIAGWNDGARAAQGEYLLFLDDDSYPDAHMLSAAVPRCDPEHIFALDIYTSREEHSLSRGPHVIPTFIGCGVIIPRELFLGLNGFEPILFFTAHEEEFSMRALQAGYDIQYLQGRAVFHRYAELRTMKSKNTVVDHRRIFYKNRNSIILLLLYFPFPIALLRILRFCAGRILFSLVHHCFRTVLKSLYDGISTSLHHWHKRSVLDKNIQRRYGYGKGLGSFFGGGDTAFKRPRWI